MWTWILLTALALGAGALLGGFWARGGIARRREAARVEAERLRARSDVETEAVRRQGQAEAREAARVRRSALAAERQRAEDGLADREARLAEATEAVAEQQEQLGDREEALAERETHAIKALDRARSIRAEAKALRAKAERLLVERAGMSAEQCAEEIAQGLVDAVRAESADRLRHLEVEPGAATVRAAKRIIGISIGRLAHRPTAVRQSFNVEVSPKAREWLEGEGSWFFDAVAELAGVQLGWIHDGAAIRIETGDGVTRVLVRRVLARSLGALPLTRERLAQALASARKDIEVEIGERGRRAFKQLGLPLADPEIVDLVGRLYFRTSYTQNQWEHAQEAAHLAGLMAAELGLDATLARRATLLHDIGKALTHQVEGSHALIGGEIARRCGEPEAVAAAIEEHHGEKPLSSVYSALVAAADGISGARPGARRELVETYGDRIQELERVARGFQGVTGAFAVQAGREVRVQVDEKRVDDARAAALASEVAAAISDQLTFPGQVRVTVIREFSTVEVAN